MQAPAASGSQTPTSGGRPCPGCSKFPPCNLQGPLGAAPGALGSSPARDSECVCVFAAGEDTPNAVPGRPAGQLLKSMHLRTGGPPLLMSLTCLVQSGETDPWTEE